MVRKEALAVSPRALRAVPLRTVRSTAPPSRNTSSYVAATCLPLEFHYSTGERGGARPPWRERTFLARLRGRVLNRRKFRFACHWSLIVRKTSERKNKKAPLHHLPMTKSSNAATPVGTSSHPNRKLKNPRNVFCSGSRRDWQIGPFLLLPPPPPSVVPDCVLEKFNSKKRLHSDARMALATFQVEETRQLVELSRADKEEDLRRMMGEKLPRNTTRKRARQNDLATTRGCFPGEKLKMLKYK